MPAASSYGLRSERLIWTYWENMPGGSTPPPHVDLCRETLARHASTCTVMYVTPQNVREFLPDLHENIDRIALEATPDVPCLAIKCAFVRAQLIEKYGGFYIDADNIVMRDLRPAFTTLERSEFACMRRTSRGKSHVSIGFYGARAGSRIITEYAGLLRALLRSRTLYKWGEVGAFLITPLVERFASTVHLFSEAEVQPVTADSRKGFSDTSAARMAEVAETALIVSLYHRLFELNGAFHGQTHQDMMSGDSLLSRCFQFALGRAGQPAP